MTAYTILNQEEIKEILMPFPIKEINSYKVLSGGSENTNYWVQTELGKIVLTICEQKSRAQAQNLALTLAHLKKHHFNTSELILTKDHQFLSMWDDKPILLKKFIDGKVIENLSMPLLQVIGKKLGQLHQIPPPDYLPTQLSYGKENFKEIAQYADGSPFQKWLEDQLSYVNPYFEMDLPKAFIHSDLFADNVIISNINEEETEATIFDFEEAAYYYRVFDIGMAIIGLCQEGKTINLEKAQSFLKGYSQEITLLETEQQALKAFTIYAGAAMTFWRHQHFNHTQPDPKKSNHYLGLKVLVDFLAEQEEDCLYKHL